jgi:hypothetical protein
LRAEIALGVGQARDAAVHAVEHHCHQHGDGGRFEAAADRGHDAVEAGEQRAGREQVGQQIDAGAAALLASRGR